jgi:Zinc carboxypeptidase
MPPAPPIPLRTNPGDYHFHAYDYASSAAFTLSPGQPNRGGMRFYSLVRDLDALLQNGQRRNVPNIALNPIGAPTAGGKRTWLLSFGNLNNQANQRTVVLTGGIHAREWIAAEIAYLVAEYLICNYVAAPPPGRVRALAHLVNNRNIHIIPMLNPDGNLRTVFGTVANDRLWRKNLRVLPNSARDWVNLVALGGVANQPFQNVRPSWMLLPWAVYDVPDYDPVRHIPPGGPPNYRTQWLSNGLTGVDLNRNFATAAYGYDCSPAFDNYDPGSDSYFGPSAGSEPETSNVRQAMVNATATTAGQLSAAIDYHSYGRLVLYPSEASNSVGGLAAGYTRLGQALQTLIRDQAGPNPNYLLGDPRTRIGYDATGSVADYAAEAHQARAFTVELDPALRDPIEFELPENQILDVFRRNIRGALAAIWAPVRQREVNQVVNLFTTWTVYNRGNQVP